MFVRGLNQTRPGLFSFALQALFALGRNALRPKLRVVTNLSYGNEKTVAVTNQIAPNFPSVGTS